MTGRRLAVLALGLGLILAIWATPGVRAVGALWSDSESVGGNTFSTADWLYYLHNNPTPPTANTNMQANLRLDTTAPTATTLFNYDQDRDANPGRMILKGGSGASESDLTKYQNWRTPALASAVTIAGSVTFEFWSAIKDFGTGKKGSVRIFLRDFNPVTSSYTEIANATHTVQNWQGGSATWVTNTVTIPVTSYTLQAGRQLEVKVLVANAAEDDMWFAYDTSAYATQLRLP